MKTKPHLAAILLLILSVTAMLGQDLEPRILSAAPNGLNFIVAGYGYSWGNVLVDPSLPVENLRARVHAGVAAYLRTFGIFGRQAKFDVVLPYTIGNWQANFLGVDTAATRIGLADPSARISIVLIGPPAVAPGEFASLKRKKFTLGVSFRAYAPLGNYQEERLLNLGTNRWTGQVVLGAQYQLGKWHIEAYLGSRFFTGNNEFLVNSELSQKPLWGAAVHVTRIFRGGIWAAFSMGQAGGGATTIDGIFKDDSVSNSRFGLTFSVPVGKRHGFKLFYATGVISNFGADFDSIFVSYQFRWMSRPKPN